MLVHENGPGSVFHKLRKLTGIEYSDDREIVSWGDWTPLTCTKCSSVYVACALLVAPSWFHKLMAASAVSTIMDKCYGESQF